MPNRETEPPQSFNLFDQYTKDETTYKELISKEISKNETTYKKQISKEETNMNWQQNDNEESGVKDQSL